MPSKIYLNLLSLCVFLSHGFTESFADEIKGGSSNFPIRQKRVVSYVPGEDKIAHIENHPYVVHIKKQNRIACVGTILSRRVVITVAECALFEARNYKVISNSARTNRGIAHDVIEIKLHYGNHPSRSMDGVALLTINQNFEFGEHTKSIDLHVGPLLPGMIGTVSGWGFNFRNGANRGTEYPTELRSIRVPILSHRDCVNRYRHIYNISDAEICTFHPQRHSGHNDGGAPLVIDGLLVGIFLRSGDLRHHYNSEFPDVFALLQHIEYSQWIRANI